MKTLDTKPIFDLMDEQIKKLELAHAAFAGIAQQAGRQLPSYHNTTGSKDAELYDREQKAKCQERRILEIWMDNKLIELTPERLIPYFHDVPITSLRRAFTNLERAGYIEKTGRKAPGHYGRDVNVYRLVK